MSERIIQQNIGTLGASAEYYDTWMYCDSTPPTILGDGWQHLGGSDFQYTPGAEFTPSLSFGGILPNRNYLISGYIEIMDSIPTRSSIRIVLGTDTGSLHSITSEDSGSVLMVLGESGSDNELLQLQAWTNETIVRFIVRDLGIRLLPEDLDIIALVDEDMKYLLDIDNTLLISEAQGI